MTGPLFSAGRPDSEPQVHALIVGVGHYPHLAGGSLHAQQPAAKTFNLQQLTSPPASAAAVADWLLSKHDNPAVPLGSIELLLSPAQYHPSAAAAARLGAAQASINVANANFDAIEAETERWFMRLRANNKNVGLFYFCGHGLEASDRYLLAADFGGKPLDWTHGIINFTKTYDNMSACAAETQVYLLDACRDRPAELQSEAAKGSVGLPLLGSTGGPTGERDAPIFHAAAPGQAAAGPTGGASYFTRALIECLDGMGSRPAASVFAPIDHVSLGTALRERVDRLARSVSLRLRCQVSGDSVLPQPTVLHQARLPVDVLTTLTCSPADADETAVIRIVDSTGEHQRPGKGEWRVTLRSGACRVSARFDQAQPFGDVEFEALALPPLFSIPVTIGERPAAGRPTP